MKLTEEDENRIRNNLLGRLSDEEEERLEERLMSDDELYDLSLAIEDELVDDYATGALTSDERERFDKFYLSTPERRRKLRLAVALSAYASRHAAEDAPDETSFKGPSRQPGGWRLSPVYWKLAAAIVVVTAAGLGIYRVFFYQSDLDKGLQALNKAYSRQRPVEARITEFDYAPYQVTRGDEEKNIDYTARHRAELILLDEVAENPSPAAHHALGRLYLAKGDLEKAVDQFEKALKGSPNNAQLHSDYGAALLESGKAASLKGESGKSFIYFGKSLEQLSKAIELDNSLLEAIFNRALCQEYMLLYREAEKDWQSYIGKDPSSKWADEARQRLKEVQDRLNQSSQNRENLFNDFLDAYRANDDARAWKLISHNRDSTGGFIENRLIDSHLNLAVNGQPNEAQKKLDALSYAAKLEREATRDLFLTDLIRFYETAAPAQRKDVLQARSLMNSGHENYSKSNLDSALGFYSRSKETFERAGATSEAALVACLIGNCYVQQSKAEIGISLLEPLIATYEKRLYRWLLARSLNALCTANQYLRDFSMAISNGNRSLTLSEEIDDAIGAVRTRYLLAASYRFVNDCQKALDLYAKDLPLARTHMPQPMQLWRHYASISLAFDQLDLYAAAIGFQKEALQLAIEAEAPRFICRSYNFLGFVLAKYGNYVEAASNIERAIETGNALSEKRVRVEALAYSFLQLGYVYRKLGDFDKAIENYDRAIQSYNELDSKFFDYWARKDKLLCCTDYDGCPSIEQEIKTLLDIFEQHRAKILEDSIRNTYFDAEQSIYDVAMEFEYFKKGDSKKAFEYSEKSRGRSLGDLINSNAQIINNLGNPDIKTGEFSKPLSAEEIRARMPEQAQILQYAVLKNSVLIWVVSKNGFSVASQTVAAKDLNKKVNDFMQLVLDTSGKSHEALLREAVSIYDLLIKPVEQMLDANKQLCIVPDKILNYLPFGALVSEASGKYFVEEHRFSLSPSSNIFVLCSEVARQKEAMKGEKLLSVGNPLFDAVTFSDLADLRSAAKEASDITAYYESPSPLIGASATKRRVMSEMEKSDIIHLATHAVADEWYPLRSKLLLAKDGSSASGKDSDGILQAYEIYKLNLQRAKMVVLSACGTGVEKYYGGEGMIGLSRPFIAKRIPLVVASLWPVNSDSTARLMVNFHRLRKSKLMPAAEALRQAQLEMIRDADGNDRLPYNWASFVAIGGYTNF